VGIDVGAQPGVTLDTDQRPTKSPRAFCAPVRVPDEVYLVIAPVGGRDDFAALFHEAGHTEHYAHVDATLPFEDRYLGDNSVTEGFAFLLESLVSNSEWLGRRLAVEDPTPIVEHTRAWKMIFLRRYAAKLAYELDLHGGGPVEGLEVIYARRLSDAIHVDWPTTTWLSDVDDFFYAARYLRAWALETHTRAALAERFGPLWFEEPEAGVFLRDLWRRGQGAEGGEGILAAVGGSELNFDALRVDLKLSA
jgi:hypothetical protein